MSSFAKIFFFFLFVCAELLAERIETFYGPIEVDEPVLLELIHSPPFQRLKNIHQYGVSYYTTHKEEYTRYDHSIGVFTVLRLKGFSLKEQIAGLLHDVSHTVFSHVGDWIFGKENREEDYQTSNHKTFLQKSGLAEILNRHGLKEGEVLPLEKYFPGLEQPLPNLCADRIDYNIQGAYYQGFITRDEGLTTLNNLQFLDNRWVGTRDDLLTKLVRYSIFMTENCWGSPINYLSSRWLADALLRDIELGNLSYEEIHFGTDNEVWYKLLSSEDPFIRERMSMIQDAGNRYDLVELPYADLVIKNKSRAIDPWILHEGETMRLTSIHPLLKEEYKSHKEKIHKGWGIQLTKFKDTNRKN